MHIERLAGVVVVADTLQSAATTKELKLFDGGIFEARLVNFIKSGLADELGQDQSSFADRKLRTVAAGELVTIVAPIIVTGREEDTHISLHSRNGESHFGIGDNIIKEIDL